MRRSGNGTHMVNASNVRRTSMRSGNGRTLRALGLAGLVVGFVVAIMSGSGCSRKETLEHTRAGTRPEAIPQKATREPEATTSPEPVAGGTQPKELVPRGKRKEELADARLSKDGRPGGTPAAKADGERLREPPSPSIKRQLREMIGSKSQLSVAHISLGRSGRLAVDGIIASARITMESAQVKDGKAIASLDSILQNTLGENRYSFNEISIKTLERKGGSIPAHWDRNEAEFRKLLEGDKFDLVVASWCNWYEHTKYPSSLFDQPPLRMDIKKHYVIYVRRAKGGDFSYGLSHEEPSEFGKDKEQKAAQKKTASEIVKKEIQVLGELGQYLREAIQE